MTPPIQEKVTIDPDTRRMLAIAQDRGISTALSRAESMVQGKNGRSGDPCGLCGIGPCALTDGNGVATLGVCGASYSAIAARSLARSVAAGAASHSDYARDLVFALLAIARGEAPSGSLEDEGKLKLIASYLGVEDENKSTSQLAEAVAMQLLESFGQQRGEIPYVGRATQKRQQIWRTLDLIPRGIDREVVETLHRTHVGNDQDPEHILMQALRTALADGWGSSMIATDVTDVIFGTPKPARARTGLGVLKADEVNVVVHGHDPVLIRALVAASHDPDLTTYAQSKGARGIALSGSGCTANDALMRHGLPSIGCFLDQELSVLTGAVDAVVVGVECETCALSSLQGPVHTRLIATSRKARIDGAIHLDVGEHDALKTANDVITIAIDNFSNRPSDLQIPGTHGELIGGFSHESVKHMQGGRFLFSFRPLHDAIISGRIRGLAGVVGCVDPRTALDASHARIIRALIENDVLVLSTGCGATAAGRRGLLAPEAASEAGPGLREVCEAIGMPPALHLGSCVDTSRILTMLADVVAESGLGEDVDELPAVVVLPGWASENALAIGAYFAASGVDVLFGVESPVAASSVVSETIGSGWRKLVGGGLEFEPDDDALLAKALERIDEKRRALRLVRHASDRFGGDAWALRSTR